MNDYDKVPRPVRWTDFLVIVMGALYNFTQVIESFFSELYELSIYHSKQQSKTMQAWEDMTADLENLQEGTDG